MPPYLIVLLAFAWFAILAGGWLGWQLLRQNGRLLLRLDELENRLNELEFGEESREPEGLPLGTEAPAFELLDLTGSRQSLTQFREQPVLLVFFNPDCGFCRELVPKLKEKTESRKQKAETSEGAVVLIISTGGAEANRKLFDGHQVGCPVLLQKDGEVAEAYQVNGTPGGYLVNGEGKIAGKLAMGAEALLELAETKAESRKLKAES